MPSATLTVTDIDSTIFRRQSKRLYNAIFLLHGLKEYFPPSPSPASHTTDDEAIETRLDNDVELYKCFVNKIAQVCDVKHGGDTVTSVTILQPGVVEYWIASNTRKSAQLAPVRSFLIDNIFKVLHGMTDAEIRDEKRVQQIESAMLLKIVGACRWRMYKYTKGLAANTGSCLASCAMESGNEAASISTRLQRLLAIAEQANSHWPLHIAAFEKETHNLLQTLKEFHTSNFASFLRRKASHEERQNTTSPWTETRHAIGRLQSYNIAVRVFLEARKRWPDLFDSPEISTFPSPPKLDPLFTIKERMCTGKDLLKRLTTDPEVHQDYEDLLPYLQGIDFDKRLRDDIKDPEGKTTVHAEVILLSNLRKQSLLPQDGAIKFFMEDKFGKYIGCSKPTCVLCDYFFDAFPVKVDRRKGHGNLYPKWRVADISPPGVALSDTSPVAVYEKLAMDRKEIMEDIIKKLKKEVTSVLVERRGSRGSRYDSRHSASDPFRSIVTAAGSVRGRGMSDSGSMIVHAQVGHDGVGNGSVSARSRVAGSILEEVAEVVDENDGRYVQGKVVEQLDKMFGQMNLSGSFQDDGDDDDTDGGAKL